MPHYKDLNNKLHWIDSAEHFSLLPIGCVPITEQEMVALQTQEKTLVETSLTYAEKRAMAYPSIQQQFDLLYHGGIAEWKTAIQTIKDKYPKA